MKFITKYSKYIYIPIIVILALLLFVNYIKFRNEKNNNEIIKNNIHYYTDTISILKNLKNEIEYSKLAIISDYTSLKNINSELAKELDKERNKKSIIQIQKIKGDIIYDTIKTKTVEIKKDTVNGEYKWNWTAFKENNYSIKGTSFANKFNLKTDIDSLNITLDLVTGIKKDNGEYSIFIKPTNNNVKINSIQGALLDKKLFVPKQKRWAFGPSVGAEWNFQTNKVQPYIGIGITRIIFKF